MAGRYYYAPFVISSLTGSLLWALTYADWLRRQRYKAIQIFLVDTWKIPEDKFYPARFLAAYLEVPVLNIPWHDDPYHEYFAFGGVPSDTIVGHVDLPWAAKWMHTLLPALRQLRLNEGLLRSHYWLRMGWTDILGRPVKGARVTYDDIADACVIADKFLCYPDNKDFRFPIAMMFLSLRKRNWDEEAWVKIRSAFKGACD